MRRERIGKNILTVLFVLISIAYMMPIVVVLFNSFKSNASINTSTFALPNAESFVGWANYQNGMTVGEYPFINSVAYSFVITILSAALILICTSMAAWYISRVDDVFSRVVYYLCVFSMIVPFQMVMFTLAKTANVLDLDTPWTIPVIYLGFGAGLAVFMFTGFVKGMPLAIEEAAAIDGVNAWQKFWKITFPLIGPFFTINLVLSMKNALGTFDQVVALTEGGPNSSTETVTYLIWKGGLTGGEYAYQTANAVLFFIVLAIIAFVQLRISRSQEQI